MRFIAAFTCAALTLNSAFALAQHDHDDHGHDDGMAMTAAPSPSNMVENGGMSIMSASLSNIPAPTASVLVAPVYSPKPAHVDEHGHGHGHGAPKLQLDEDEIARQHGIDPPSYWDHDTSREKLGDDHGGHKSYGGLMIVHVASMIVAFFGLLPIGIVLRVAKHPFHSFVQLVFVGFVIVGWLFSVIYRNLTPDMYEGEKHSNLGYVMLFAVVVITFSDIVRLVRQFVSFVQGNSKSTDGRFSFSELVKNTLQRRIGGARSGEEYEVFRSEEYDGLVEESESYDHREVPSNAHVSGDVSPSLSSSPRHAHFDEIDLLQHDQGRHQEEDEEWYEKKDFKSTHQVQSAGAPRRSRPHYMRHSYNSESTTSTLRDDMPSPVRSSHSDNIPTPAPAPAPRTLKQKISAFTGTAVYLAEWLLVYLAFAQVLTGGIVYTGICRRGYINSCLAHTIKGGIFFLYGVLTFCRYLGAFAKYGWAWNRAPTAPSPNGDPTSKKTSSYVTAEMIECSVIFTYGITNTWLERTGAAPGSPYATKEIQHIGIAVMFWFAGLVGMGLESKSIRRLLSRSAFAAASPTEHDYEVAEAQIKEEPMTYSGSFNPFPAIVIGVTGAAMAAHHQAYLFAVQVHSLWGNLLLAFSVMRCMTYVFLWLRPPTGERSVLPSRPPSEALASFFLACGGLTFISSTEQVVWGAMRHGRDDIMMFLNVMVALTCFVFAWCVLVLAIKGWALGRVAAKSRKQPVSV